MAKESHITGLLTLPLPLYTFVTVALLCCSRLYTCAPFNWPFNHTHETYLQNFISSNTVSTEVEYIFNTGLLPVFLSHKMGNNNVISRGGQFQIFLSLINIDTQNRQKTVEFHRNIILIHLLKK